MSLCLVPEPIQRRLEADVMQFRKDLAAYEDDMVALTCRRERARAMLEYSAALLDEVRTPANTSKPKAHPTADDVTTAPAGKVLDAPAVTANSDRMAAARQAKAARNAAVPKG